MFLWLIHLFHNVPRFTKPLKMTQSKPIFCLHHIKLKGLLLLIAYTFSGQFVSGQTSYNDPSDNQIWAGLDMKFNDLPKNLSLEIGYQQRYWNNANDLKGHYTNVELAYRVNKHLDLLTDYRLSLRDKGQYHRFSIGAAYDQKIWKLKLAARVLFQNQLQDYTDQINYLKPDENFFFYRGRLKGSYKINKKIDVYASVEPIFRVGGVFIVDNWRSQLGITYDITKDLKSDIYFIYREDYAKATYNRYFYISGVNLSYKFSKPKKKHKPLINPTF